MSTIKVYGKYTPIGYDIYVGNVRVYTAGNSPHDSAVALQEEDGLGLKAMRASCITTGREIAGETAGGRWIGAEREEA